MATLAERIMDVIRDAPLDDDELTKLLGVSSRQAVNQVARLLESQGRVVRSRGADGKIVNSLPGTAPTGPGRVVPRNRPRDLLTEDEVKKALDDHLTALGFEVMVAWGKAKGIDVDAQHADGRRIVVEAKGEVGHNGAQQANYFLGALGELVQRMDDPNAAYALALPANKQYRGLVQRLPRHARERLGLAVFWVSRDRGTLKVEADL